MLLSNMHKQLTEAGCDEAGRGCLAGPVFAAAVIFPADYKNELLNDSKKLSEKKRYFLREQIIKDSLDWAVASIDHSEIDKINILNASLKAMHKALEKLKNIPEHILVDGNRFHPYQNIPHTCIIKGDGKYLSIAAASVLAKTFRDDYMNAMHIKHPEYDWINNKGYPTKKHREGIIKYGITEIHRKTFQLLPDSFKLNLK